MDKKIRTFAERETASKRKFENTLRNTQNQQQQHSNKRQNTGRVYTASSSRAGTDPDANVVTGKGVCSGQCRDKPGCEHRYSSQFDIAPIVLDHDYAMNHPFNIDLMPVEMGSFDVIIGMDWLSRYQAVIICADKIVRIPWGRETLIFHGDVSNQEHETQLNIISCAKTQKYMLMGCQVFLAHVTTKEAEGKSEKKRLENVPIVRDFP
nr:reverse transcriptase domain-containing protein [Tanacetum cinerariifolium]